MRKRGHSIADLVEDLEQFGNEVNTVRMIGEAFTKEPLTESGTVDLVEIEPGVWAAPMKRRKRNSKASELRDAIESAFERIERGIRG